MCVRCGFDGDGVTGYGRELYPVLVRSSPPPPAPPPGDVIVVELMSGMLVFSHYVICMAFLAVADLMERLVMD